MDRTVLLALVMTGLMMGCGRRDDASAPETASPPTATTEPPPAERVPPEQAVEIETALDDFSLYYQMLHSQMEEVMATSKSRIDQVLNEAQRKKFSRIMAELKQAR